jgi:hypothetical protein
MNQNLVSTMAEVRLRALPELAGVITTMDELLRVAEDDDPALDKFSGALKLFTILRDQIWELQRQCEADALARFRRRSAATICGLVVAALAELSPETIVVALQRLEDFMTSSNAAIQRNREEADRQAVIRREAEIEARARKMDITQIVKEAEANDTQLSTDAEGRILVKGQLSPDAKLMIGVARDRVVAFLRARDSQRERREVI